MSSHWHPDLKVRKIEDWLIEARLVYSVHDISYQNWIEFNTLRDGLEIGDEPIYFIANQPEAIEWAAEYLARSSLFPALLAYWQATPTSDAAGMMAQLRELAESRPSGQSGQDRLYELLTVRAGPFRSWSALEGLRPHVEVS